MPADELTAFRRLYLDGGMTATWDGAITLVAGGAVGGGTLVNWMTCIAPPAAIRSEWASVRGLDGFDGEELAADLEELERELEISDAPNIPPKDAVILRGAGALGYEASVVRRNGVGCGDCGTCPFGCRSGAKRSGLRVHLAEAYRAGARIVADAPVARVLMERGAAAGVEAIHRPEGAERARRLTVRSRQVVIAAGALRTPVILERSGLRHPAIGRHLRLHPVPVAAGRFVEPIEMWRWTTQAARSEHRAHPGEDVRDYVIESAPGHPGLVALAFPWEGTDAFAALLERVRWFAPLIAITRDSGEGRVRLTRAGRARVDYDLAAGDVVTMRHALVRMARIARAAGAHEIVALGTPPAWHGRDGFPRGGEERAFRSFEEQLGRFDFAPNRATVFSAHQMGTARAGADRRDHVCDPRGRVRAGAVSRDEVVRGLYVGDGSLFPTGIAVNPMLTVMALARRVARTVLAGG